MENDKNRRKPVNRYIQHMLDERKELLSLLIQLSHLEKNHAVPDDVEMLEEFCEVLVDYIASAHFSLYERIVDGKERRKTVADIARSIYPQIEYSTEKILTFNEKYNADNQDRKLENLATDLSEVGMILASRIDLEDKLIAALLE